MSKDDEAARKTRAEQLRKQISKYKKKDHAGEEEASSDEPESESSAGKSPREFIHERMRELDDEDK